MTIWKIDLQKSTMASDVCPKGWETTEDHAWCTSFDHLVAMKCQQNLVLFDERIILTGMMVGYKGL